MKDQNPYSISELQSSGDLQAPGSKFDQQVRVMQIVAVAMMMGVLSFLFVVLVVTQGNVLTLREPDVLSLIATGFAMVTVIVHFVVPNVISQIQMQQSLSEERATENEQSKIEKLGVIFQTRMIVAMALLEGAAFFNLVILMMNKNVINLGVVVALLGLMLIRFPTKTKVMWWIQDRLRQL